jgi:hypothetical protein
MFGRRKSTSPEPPTELLNSSPEEKPPTDFLKRISIRQHAAIVGMLVERHVLLTSNSLYVVEGNSPEADRILHIDSGLMWIAIAIRLAGDIAGAEDALREAIWRYAKLVGTDMRPLGTADINLAVAEAMVEQWQKTPGDWFMGILSAAFQYLHPGAAITPAGIGGIWQDAWRLHAGMLSVLGDATSRRVPGDSGDYCC